MTDLACYVLYLVLDFFSKPRISLVGAPFLVLAVNAVTDQSYFLALGLVIAGAIANAFVEFLKRVAL